VRERCDDGLFGAVSTHVSSGVVRYSGDAAAVCLTPYLEARCEDLGGVTGNPAIECGDVFVGTKKAGEPCEFDQMCERPLFCRPGADGTCPGTCAAKSGPGEACNGLRQLCADGLTCTGFGDRDGTCVRSKVGRGEACELGLQCPDGQFCDDASGRCTDLLGPGAPCPGFGCRSGLTCAGESQSRSCQALPGLGEPCEFTCAEGLVCHTFDEVCVTAPQKAGDPCVTAIWPCGVGTGLQCRNSDGTCVGPQPIGTACGGDTGISRCDFGWCDGTFQQAGQCRPWLEFGAACEPFNGSCGPFECFQGSCSLPGGPCRGPRVGSW
jgi:hypothetical protein